MPTGDNGRASAAGRPPQSGPRAAPHGPARSAAGAEFSPCSERGRSRPVQPRDVGDRFVQPCALLLTSGRFQGPEQHSARPGLAVTKPRVRLRPQICRPRRLALCPRGFLVLTDFPAFRTQAFVTLGRLEAQVGAARCKSQGRGAWRAVRMRVLASSPRKPWPLLSIRVHSTDF